jgi:hypothetical protein
METRFCPDCGCDRPLTDFYRVKAASYAGGYRYGAYCKEHTRQRSAQAMRDAPQDSPLREKARTSKREWIKAHPEVNRRNQAATRARKKTQTGDETP